MSYSIYEYISIDQPFMVNAFVTSIQSSTYHWHSEYEMLGIIKGSVEVKVRSESEILRKGELLLINPNVFHAIKCLEEENLCMVIQMHPDLFREEEGSNYDIRFYLDSTKEEIPACGFRHFFLRMAQVVYETVAEDKYAKLRARAQACCLIVDLLEYVVHDLHFCESKSQDSKELVIEIIHFIEGNLTEENIVELICKKFGISRKTLDRNLKMVVGVTAKEIIENLRVEKARDLLKNSNKNMNYILDVCGFGSEKTFYRVFKNETGMTPNEFRKKGQIEFYNDTLKDYLNFDKIEAIEILKEVIENQERDTKLEKGKNAIR